RTSIFYNPLLHVPNVGAAWFTEGGVSRYLPSNVKNMVSAGRRASVAVTKLNDDYIKALEAGAPLQAYRPEANELSKMFFEQLGDAMDQDKSFAKKIREAIGEWNP